MLTLNAIATLRAIKGDPQAAVKAHSETLGVFRTIGDRQSEAATLTGIGQDFDLLNERPTALDYYEQALNLALRSGSLDFASVVLYQIAAVYRAMGESDKALTYYGRCIRLSRAIGKSRMAAYALNDTAAIYAERGEGDQTLKQYRKALRLFQAIGDRLGQAVTLNGIGDYFSALKDRRRALDFYRRAQPFSHESGDRELEVSTLYKLARAARDNGELENAVSHVRQSIEMIELLRSYVASPDLRSSYFASVHPHYELYIDLLMQLERQRPGEGFAETALQACERARARSLVEILAEADADLRRGAAPAQLERERMLRDMLRGKARQQLELANNQPAGGELDEIAREIRRLSAEYQLVQAQLREQNPRYAALAPSDPLSVTEIQARLLDQDTVLLEFSLGEERSYLWAITAGSFSSYELPGRAELEGTAREVYDLLTARVPPGGGIDPGYQDRVETADRRYFEKARHLSRMLLGPAAALLGHKRLLIVGEGILQYIPFDALPVPSTERDGQPGARDGRPGDSSVPADPAFLVSSHEIVTLPSISTLVALRKEESRAGPSDKLVAVLADPVFTVNDSRVGNAGDPRSGTAPLNAKQEPAQPALRDFNGLIGNGGFRRLRETQREAELIVAAAPRGTGLMVTGFEANREAALNARLKPYRILHFATHSLVNSEHPELSGIVLSQVNHAGERQDGFLQLSDIYSMNLSADLVVLSACNTGLGKNVKGEGLVGLTRGFMYVGSKSVVASLWKVDDQATAELMGLFYEGVLQKGLRPAAALRAAKESLRRQKPWRAPYFWAAFVIQGEYKDPIPVGDQDASETRLVIPLAALLILVSAFVFLKRRRRLHLR
jgi:CHAT domain-containing protein/tetratricopeptide (TPR) repeat protein